MSVIRAFIAIELPSEILHCLEEVSTQLKQRLEDVPLRWAPVPNIHLTLKFLGDVSPSNIDVLTDILQTLASSYQMIEISVGGLGAYPRRHRPRVIWIGVEAPPELMAAQRSIESETARLGYARERRIYAPHLTLGRVSRHATSRDVRKIAEVLESYKVGFLGVVRVRSINLYRSVLKPSGAVYTCLFTARLSK